PPPPRSPPLPYTTLFRSSHGVGDRLMRAAAALVAGGAGTLMLGHHGPPLVARWLPAVLLASGLLCFLAQSARLYRRRLRRALDRSEEHTSEVQSREHLVC